MAKIYFKIVCRGDVFTDIAKAFATTPATAIPPWLDAIYRVRSACSQTTE